MYLFYGFCKNGLKYEYLHTAQFFMHSLYKKPTLGSKLKSSAKILIHDNKNSHHCDGDDDVRLF